MLWFFHVLWLVLVIVLFFLILRRIYYFGMQGTEHEYDSQPTRNNSQQYYIFTVYGSQSQTERRQTIPDLPPNYEPPQPPPLYEDVIKSPELYQKPPPAYNVV